MSRQFALCAARALHVGAAALWLAQGAAAQTPDAALPEPAAAPVAEQAVPGSAPPPAAAPATAFELRQVRFAGASVLDEASLQALAAPYVGRAVTLPELEALAASVTEAYRARGYFLAQAVVPVQSVTAGVVEISVVEGRLGSIELRMAPETPISEERVRVFLAPMRRGEVVHADTYERAMLLLSDQPGLRATSGLQAGTQPGSYDLVVEVAPARRLAAVLEADNHGTREVGRYRAGGTLRWRSPFGVGDNLDARLMVSDEELVFGRLAYELPLGSSGLRAGIGLARVQYQLEGECSPLDAHGQADVLDLTLSYPFIRQRNHNLVGRLVFDSKRLKDEYRAVDVSFDKRVHGVGLGWAWDRRDSLLGGGYFASAGTLYSGRLRLRDADARAADQAAGGLRTHGDFTKLQMQFSRLQAVAAGHSLYYAFAGQWADRNLDPSEKLALGGARAVRAYPSGEALVDQGWIQTLEWRWSASETLTPYLFFDAAHGRVHKRPPAGSGDNGISLRGGGVGLHWGKPGDFSLNASLAWRTTREARTDGRDRKPRFYIQGQKWF